MEICYLGVGSNLGKRTKNIILAVNKIKALKLTKVVKVSRKFITDPAGGPAGQGKFLNAAIKVKTSLSPFMFLKQLKKIERELGRKKNVLNGPRTIDLDILFYGERAIKTDILTVPHPRLFFRDFVLKPLSEII
jgi:2-amino-4-hydroxy-6-hydroxymethyldihydropteridine diphosphokinase